MSRRTLSLSGLVGLLVVGCASSPPAVEPAGAPPAVVAPPEAPPSPAREAAPAADVPIAFPASGGLPAWLDPVPAWSEDDDDAPILPLDDVDDVAVGRKAALVRSARGPVFLVDADHGYVATVGPPPQTIWLGMDADDRAYAATADGTLWARTSGGFEIAGQVPGAIAWDAAALVVATDGRQVLVSADGGKTFKAHAPARTPVTIKQVLTRADGVIVAVGTSGKRAAPAAWISRDRGARWAPSAYQPTRLARVGAVIWNADWDCPASLATDGATWSPVHLDAPPAWSTLMTTAELVEASPRDLSRTSVSYPPAPEPMRPAVRGRGHCRHGTGTGSGRGTFSRGAACKGVACLRGHLNAGVRATRTAAALLRDGACDRAGDRTWGCAADAALVRRPHVAIQDREAGAVRVVELPAACADPAELTSAHGVGLLTCERPPGVDLFVVDRDGRWHAEGALPAAALTTWATTAASDGTLVLHASCPRSVPCVAMVRNPQPPGTAAAWRTVAIADAVGYRAVPGGVLAIVADAERPERLRLVVDRGAGPSVLVDTAIVGDLTVVELDAAGRVVLGLRQGEQRESAIVWIRGDGAVEPATGVTFRPIEPVDRAAFGP